MRSELVDAVLARLALERPAPDLEGLRAVYRSWCAAVPFDNTLKLIHIAERQRGPLPGSSAESFFDAWLEHGTGGTCWAGNGALHDLLEALGFRVERALATMMAVPDPLSPNHGSVIVTIAESRWIADASVLSGVPIAILERGGTAVDGPLPRLVWLEGKPAVLWRSLAAPDGFHCRIDRIGAKREEWDALHRRTAAWSPFNYQLNSRLLRGDRAVGAAAGRRFAFDADGTLASSPLEGEERPRFLVDELGISEAIARRIPPDLPIPPRPRFG
jgi:N-hydroxyarylamine O-acetyltransferase